jgi:hypothetical protein
MSDTTAYTIISRDVELLEWSYTNARDRADYDHEWLIIGWDPTAEIKKYCKDNKLRLVLYKPKPETDFKSRTAWFLHNLYACWNLGYEKAQTKWVARMGSDQFFSQGWLRELHVAATLHGERATYHTWTIESPIAHRSRHEIHSFGTVPNEFDTLRFDQYATTLQRHHAHDRPWPRSHCNLWYHHPVKGMEQRPDGCTWLQTKALWEVFGPLADTVIPPGIAGDVDYMDRLYDAGVEGYLLPRSVCFHLVQGEYRTLTP